MLRRSLVLAGIALLATAGSASAATRVNGIVVGHQRGALLVASSTGFVRAVSGRAAIGARISMAGGHLVTLGRTHHAVIRGVVVRRRGSLTFLSASGHMLVVRSIRKLASVRDTTPAPGSVVDTSVTIDDQGNLDDQGETQVGNVGQVQVQAVVSAVAAGSVTLTVNGQQLTVPLPAGLTLPAGLVGQQVTLNVSFGNGQATATGEQDDDNNNGGGDNGTGLGLTGGLGLSGSFDQSGGNGDGGGATNNS